MATATASSYGESTSVFEARLQASGIPDEDAKKIKTHISSLKQLAFVSSFTPAQADEKPLMDELEAMLGRRPETGVKASFRALFHESYAPVTSEVRQRVERSEEVQVRRLSQPERAERYNKQVSKLKGITIKGPSEPSETLVDLAVGAYEANELRYIPWDRCTSREQEVSSEKKREIKLTLDEPSGKLKVDSKTTEEVADTSSEILVLQALQRRALAMGQANLLDYEKGDMWAQRLLRARMTDPPPLFARPSWKQLMEADRKLFSELRDRARSGVQADTSGRPLDRNIVAVMESYDVSCLLQPVPTAAGKAELEDHGSKRAHPYGGAAAGRGKGRGGKGKGKGSGNVKLPQGLEGCRSSTNRGEPICFAHNLGHCSNPVSNGRRIKGLHICAVPKCGAHSHGASACPKRKVE